MPDVVLYMIRTKIALLRHAQEFFRSDLLGVYSWDKDVKIDPPELREALPPNLSAPDRRRRMEAREGGGKYLEKERLRFGPWEILIYSAQERGPIGEVTLRRTDGFEVRDLVAGPLDPSTWAKIGEYIRLSHQRKAS
jgi:hypothetical protein